MPIPILGLLRMDGISVHGEFIRAGRATLAIPVHMYKAATSVY